VLPFSNAGEQERPPSDYQQPVCSTSSTSDQEHDTAVDNWVRGLFPAMQLLFDSPVLSFCSRFVVETARVQALSLLPGTPPVVLISAEQQAALWRGKCEAKVRHLGTCAVLGVYYDVPAPHYWPALLPRHCDVSVHPQWDYSKVFITPWCVAVDQTSRRMYNARQCLLLIMTPAERLQQAAAQVRHAL
jgi:hypothetical protein